MRRLLVTILSVLYMASASGATINVHYCMGKVMNTTFTVSDTDQCDNCGMKKGKKNHCCKDEQQTLKTADHQFAPLSFDFSHQQIALPPYLPAYNHYKEPVYISVAAGITQAHAPPSLWRSCPIYITIRNFRI